MNKLDLYQRDFSKRNYWLAIAIAVDQLVNTVFGGYMDETLSSRIHRESHKRTEKFIDTLFWFDRQGSIRHCELAYYGELAREHFPLTS